MLRPDGKPWGRDKRLAHDLKRTDIVAGAKKFESAGCRFWIQVGHGCSPHLEIATVAEVLNAAPNTCLGFVSAEDEQLGAVPYYFQRFIRPILELCLKHKKRFILRNKDVWWLHWPADSRLRQLIFDGRYRSVILPSVEDSNSRTTDAQLAARVGLWLDGQVDNWCCRVSADWFCASRSWEWETVMTGHPHLRYLTSQASLGARVFMFLSGERTRRSGQWTRVGKEGAANFLDILGKQILVPPRREQLRAVSSVVLAMREPTKRFTEHGANGHHNERWNDDGTDAGRWAFDRLDCYWAMAPLPPSDVSTFLWGRTRRSSENLAVTASHGFVCILPGGRTNARERWSSLWTTNGDNLSKGTGTMPLPDARAAITSDLADAARVFPFRVEGHVFHQIIEQTPGQMLLVLIDPGWLDPAERDVKITANLPGDWTVRDRLTGEPLGDLGRPVALSVPAGVFRLVDLRRQAAEK